MGNWYEKAIRRLGPGDKFGYPTWVPMLLREKWQMKTGVVFHSSEGGLQGAFGELDSQVRPRKSWQFTIDKDGTTYQHYPADANCWHTGKTDKNKELAGIEFVGRAGEVLTDEQVKAGAGVAVWLAELFSWRELARQGATKTLWEHREISAVSCPSGRIPWLRVREEAAKIQEKELDPNKQYIALMGLRLAEAAIGVKPLKKGEELWFVNLGKLIAKKYGLT